MKKLTFITNFIVIFYVLFAPVSATETRNKLAHYQLEQDRVIFTLTDNTKVRVSLLNNNSVEVLYNAERQQLPSFALASPQYVLKPSIEDSLQTLEISHGDIAVRVTKSPFSLAFAYQDELRTHEEVGYFNVDSLHGFRFSLTAEEKLYGGGQRVLGMDRRGHRMPLYNRAHYGYTTESNQMYYSLSAVMSSRNYAIVFDNTARGNLDIGHAQPNVLQFDATGGRAAYLVVMGETLADVSTNLVSLTGRQPLPPRWALGNFASRFGYRNEQQTRDVVKRYQDANIPLDAVVLDLYWFGKDVKGHMGNLEWDTDSFPNPEKMLTDLRDQGIKTVVITEPFILTTSKQFDSAVEAGALAKTLNGEAKTFDFFFGNTGLVDVFNSTGQDWFSQFYTQLHEQGVAGWWGDLGEPEVHPYDTIHQFNNQRYTGDTLHNAYGHKWAEMVYQHSLTLAPQQRPFVLMRSGFMGSQRHGMIPWTGDVSRSWDGLKPQVELSLQMGIFGLAYTHSDLGGFAGGEKFDPELYLRWLQLGVFQPVFRPHAQEDIAPEPVFHDAKTIHRAKALINLRYQMLPYNYSLAIENSLTGLPFMRPLSFYHTESQWFSDSRSFYWGASLLVSPITDPGITEWSVNLPAGNWFNFFTQARYEGGKEHIIPVTETTFPILVKAGAIIPTVAPAANTEQTDLSNMTIHVWLDQSGKQHSYTYYEDDGHSPASIAKQQLVKAHISHQTRVSKRGDGTSIVSTWQGAYAGMPEARTVDWVIYGLSEKPNRVMIDDKTYQVNESEGIPQHDLTAAIRNDQADQMPSTQASAKTREQVNISWQSQNQTLVMRGVQSAMQSNQQSEASTIWIE